MKHHEKTNLLARTITVLLLLGCTAVFSADEQETAQTSYEDYKIIFERNIFSKDRLPPRQTPSQRVRTTQVLAIYVLRGTAVERDERVAFIEEQISGQTMKARTGDEVLNGCITEIRFDRVGFEENGQTKYIRIGGEFGKTETTVMTTVSPESDESPSETSTSAPAEQPVNTDSSGGENDILKRLMERRQSELGQ